MRRLLLSLSLASLVAGGARATALPGFTVRPIATAAGFLTSLAVDSHGILYYTTQRGDLFRLDAAGLSHLVAHVDTVALGDSGLLGMALRDDRTAVVHYTTPQQVADVVSSIDLETGAETILHSFDADIDVPSRGSPPEHHGGNPSVAADGSIFVGIGDYGGGLISQLPDWNGGKIWRVFPDGHAEQFARGLRNPFEVAWDAANQRLIAPDNGVAVDDEINVVHAGDNLGWPYTMGNGVEIAGTVRPVYVFPTIVAPTGFLSLSGRNPILQRGYLLGAFVTKAIYYIADVDHADPIPLVKGETAMVIDVTEGAAGEIFFATGMAIYQLNAPRRGDVNGDGRVDTADLDALAKELADGAGEAFTNAQNGAFAASWGADANGDGVIDANDMTALMAMLKPRVRAARPPG